MSEREFYCPQCGEDGLMCPCDDDMKPILNTTRSLMAPLIIDLDQKVQLETDKCNLAIFRASMVVKALEKKR